MQVIYLFRQSVDNLSRKESNLFFLNLPILSLYLSLSLPLPMIDGMCGRAEVRLQLCINGVIGLLNPVAAATLCAR